MEERAQMKRAKIEALEAKIADFKLLKEGREQFENLSAKKQEQIEAMIKESVFLLDS